MLMELIGFVGVAWVFYTLLTDDDSPRKESQCVATSDGQNATLLPHSASWDASASSGR